MREIEEMVCFDLYAASRAMTGLYRPLLDPLGLTYPQYLVLLALPWEGSCTVGDLAGRLDLDHGTTSPLLRRMESAGLVVRRRTARDERVVEVGLTPEGRATRARLDDVQCAVQDAVGMRAPDLADLQDTLKALASRVRDVAAGRER